MFNNYTYKQKNRFLIGAIILLAIVSYNMALKNTIHAYREMKSLEVKSKLANDAPQKVAELNARLINMDYVLGRSQLLDTTAQQTLLGIVTDYCKNKGIILREFPKTVQKKQGEYLVETNSFIVEGSFIKILELLYLLEQKNRVGKVVSSSFVTGKDFKTKTINLTASIYIQNVKKISK